MKYFFLIGCIVSYCTAQQDFDQQVTRDCNFAVEQLTLDSGFPFRITLPGLYCVGTNIGISPNGIQAGTNVIPLNASPAIIIQSNNVTLDLNGFTMRGSTNNMVGIVILPGYSCIVIRNGTLIGMSTAIRANSTTNNSSLMVFENITLIDNAVGIQLTSISNFALNNCVIIVRTSQLPNAQGLLFQNCNHGLIKNTKVIQNSIGFSLNNCNALTYESCSAYKNGAYGFYQQAGSSISYNDCHAYDTAGNGFYSTADANNNTVSLSSFNECSALRNTLDGFYLAINNSRLQTCTSSGNANGFVLRGKANSIIESIANNNTQVGFGVYSTNNQLRNNTAMSNAIGFLDQASNNHFYSNVANAHRTANYQNIPNVATSPTFNAPINSTANIAE